jgi:hypothetical protein
MHRALANPACAVITWHAPQTRRAGPGAGNVECQQGWHWGMDGRCRAAAAGPPEVSVRLSSEYPGRGGDRASRTCIDDSGAEAPSDDHEGHARGRGGYGLAAVLRGAHAASQLGLRVFAAGGQAKRQEGHGRTRLGGYYLRYRWNHSAETGHDHS